MIGSLYRVSIHTVPVLADILEEALPAAGYPVSLWTDAEATVSRLDHFAADREQADAAETALRALCADLSRGEAWRIDTAVIPREDWAESWKRFFHPERVSDRLIVRPSWETMPLREGDREVVIDAGMCFGTGQHGTTRACLKFLDALSAAGRSGSLLDAGCGSGILSIAGAKLGFAPVTAIDLDASAVEQAAENARRNGVFDSIAFSAANVLEYEPPVAFDVVAANIEAPILLEAAGRFAGRLCSPRPGAALLLAGILERQYAGVADAFTQLGFHECQRLSLDGWTSGWWQRR